jgi:hypothetical protein
MSYLEIARRVESRTKETKEVRDERSNDLSAGYERNELHEKSPVPGAPDAELLKARIIETLDVEPEHFNREEYDRLCVLWHAQNPKEESTP